MNRTPTNRPNVHPLFQAKKKKKLYKSKNKARDGCPYRAVSVAVAIFSILAPSHSFGVFFLSEAFNRISHDVRGNVVLFEFDWTKMATKTDLSGLPYIRERSSSGSSSRIRTTMAWTFLYYETSSSMIYSIQGTNRIPRVHRSLRLCIHLRIRLRRYTFIHQLILIKGTYTRHIIECKFVLTIHVGCMTQLDIHASALHASSADLLVNVWLTLSARMPGKVNTAGKSTINAIEKLKIAGAPFELWIQGLLTYRLRGWIYSNDCHGSGLSKHLYARKKIEIFTNIKVHVNAYGKKKNDSRFSKCIRNQNAKIMKYQ